MPRYLPLAGLALALAGCTAFPELDEQISDRARDTGYMSIAPLETVTRDVPSERAEAVDTEGMMTAGLALQARGGATPTPGLTQTARASQERAERAIAEAALARLRLEEGETSVAEATALTERAETLLASAEAAIIAGDALEAERAGAALEAAADEVAAEDPATEDEIADRVDALIARTEALREGRIDEARRLLLQRARELMEE